MVLPQARDHHRSARRVRRRDYQGCPPPPLTRPSGRTRPGRVGLPSPHRRAAIQLVKVKHWPERGCRVARCGGHHHHGARSRASGERAHQGSSAGPGAPDQERPTRSTDDVRPLRPAGRSPLPCGSTSAVAPTPGSRSASTPARWGVRTSKTLCARGPERSGNGPDKPAGSRCPQPLGKLNSRLGDIPAASPRLPQRRSPERPQAPPASLRLSQRAASAPG